MLPQIPKSIPNVRYLSYLILDVSELYEVIGLGFSIRGQGEEGTASVCSWVCNRMVRKVPDPEGICGKCTQN